MPQINPSIPVAGQPNSTEEPKIVTALTQLVGAVNTVDAAQIVDGTITTAELAAAVAQALVPAGSLIATARATADTGYLLCDGAAISRSTYATLFAAISTTFGVGDGTTTFNVPDLRGRVPVGVDNMGGTSADRIASGHSRALAQSGGEELHTLTIAEMPSHTHVLNLAAAAQAAAGTGSPAYSGGAGTSNVNANTGGGTSHNVMQPYLVITYQIKT